MSVVLAGVSLSRSLGSSPSSVFLREDGTVGVAFVTGEDDLRELSVKRTPCRPLGRWSLTASGLRCQRGEIVRGSRAGGRAMVGGMGRGDDGRDRVYRWGGYC